MNNKNNTGYFSVFERFLWLVSITVIVATYIIFSKGDVLFLVASVIGVTSLIYNAKASPVGMFLMVIFSVLYGLISYEMAYYGEMVTYMGMTGPMSFASFIAWLKHPFKGNKREVEIYSIKRNDMTVIAYLTIIVTVVFYFILKYWGTANLLFSTISVTTSFIAVCLTYKRSLYFTFVYALNDIVLIVLWSIAATKDISYISVLSCFIMFLVSDLYSFISLKRICNRQSNEKIVS